jgi:hypothetical protein
LVLRRSFMDVRRSSLRMPSFCCNGFFGILGYLLGVRWKLISRLYITLYYFYKSSLGWDSSKYLGNAIYGQFFCFLLLFCSMRKYCETVCQTSNSGRSC